LLTKSKNEKSDQESTAECGIGNGDSWDDAYCGKDKCWTRRKWFRDENLGAKGATVKAATALLLNHRIQRLGGMLRVPALGASRTRPVVAHAHEPFRQAERASVT
ncbi:MAG TPA: hypothetical protein VJP83_17360, partial [Terriglobales bacterium]|nr:hypothetical protein [Terriglobales bacterium]